MKKILLATTVLSMTAGFAAAEVSVSGDARMGVVATDGASTFSSRMRIKFTGSGTTDGGLAFGGSFRANDAQGAKAGTAGSVFISGAFGKISMGDVDSGDAAAVGQLASVGYTGLGSTNSINYAADGFDLFGLPALLVDSSTAKTYYGDVQRVGCDPEFPLLLATCTNVELTDDEVDSFFNDDVGANVYLHDALKTAYSTTVSGGAPAKVLYTYSANGLTVNASASQISNGPTDFNSYGLGVAYTTGGLTVAAGYGSNEFGFVTSNLYTSTEYMDGYSQSVSSPWWKGTVSDGSVTDASLSVTYVMGDTTLKAIYQDKQIDATYTDSYLDDDLQVWEDEDSVDVSGEATSMGLSVSHKIGALTLTAFGITTDLSTDILYETADSVSFTRTGIGASYDLGGGATVTGGAVNVEAAALDGDWELESVSKTAYDLGVNFSF